MIEDYTQEEYEKDEKQWAMFQEALVEFDRVQNACQAERQQCIEDRRFATIPGAMWEDALGEQFENLPKPEANRIRLSVNRILNEYRQNRVTVNFLPADGSESDVSETLNGLFRSDENDSNAQLAYLNCFDEKLNGGIGAWRLRACYEDEYDPENERQRTVFEPIVDADTSVFFDLDSKKQDHSDAKKCWVLSSVSPKWVKDNYGVDASSITKNDYSTYFDWFTPDVVYIAEYYCVEEFNKRLIKFRNVLNEEIKTIDKKELTDELLGELTALGYVEESRRTVKDRKVRKMLICGSQVLEDYGYIAGKNIPIVIDYGQRWFVDNIERCMGHVRLAKDVSRIINMILSKLAQIASESSTSVPILTPSMVANGLQDMWANKNVNNPPYMLINGMIDESSGNEVVPALQYTQTPQIPPAIVALYELAASMLNDILGNQQEGEKLRANTSDKAVELVQNRIDQQSYVYFDNHCIAMRRAGEIWLDMAKELYIEEGRKMKVIDDKGIRGQIELKRPTMVDGLQVLENDFDNIKMEVVVDVGEAYSSRREKTVSNLTKLLPVVAQASPQDANVVAASIMMNMEGEAVGDLQKYYRSKLVAAGILEPTEDEKEELAAAQANQQPAPQDLYLLAEAEKQSALAKKAQVDTAKVLAETDKVKMETAKLMSDLSTDEQQRLINEIEAVLKVSQATATPANVAS
jgi:hypothetical protein